MDRRRRSPVVLLGAPLVVAALAVAALVGFVNLGAGPQVGTITTRTWIDGELVARIEAPAAYSDSSGDLVVAELALPEEYHTATTVPVRVLSDWSIEIAEPGFRMPGLGILMVFAGLGALAGLVIVFNLRGYGFVRGTGEPGTMKLGDVEEDKEFYWRS